MPIRLASAGLGLLITCHVLGGQAASPPVGFLSDFGQANEAVATCKGAMLRAAPGLQIVDICHNVPPFDIWEAALMLRETTTFPDHTVFVAVVDPGVGSDRSAIAVRTGRSYTYVAPNNGLLTWVIRQQGIKEVIELDPLKVNPEWKPGTFDGRDLFSPAAALLARKPKSFHSIGRPMDFGRLVLLDIPEVTLAPGRLEAAGERIDRPYGNLLTLVSRAHLEQAGIAPGQRLTVMFAGGPTIELPLVQTFSDVPEGEPLAYIDARGQLAFAVNLGDFAGQFGVKARDRFVVKTIEP
jgi:S-adenosylmethionine hydrolase